MKKTSLVPGKYFHIYNRGNNSQNIFFESANYAYFMMRYDQYVSPVCDTIAWALLRNHFHFLVYVKPIEEIITEKLDYNTIEKLRKISAALQVGHLFNAYAKAINKRYNRTWSLFEKNFERKEVASSTHLKNFIHYVHQNPVHLELANSPSGYSWSSYKSVLSHEPTKLKTKFGLALFESRDQCQRLHIDEVNLESIRDLIMK